MAAHQRRQSRPVNEQAAQNKIERFQEILRTRDKELENYSSNSEMELYESDEEPDIDEEGGVI